MNEIINRYYENNGYLVQKIVQRVLNEKFGGMKGKDLDEFYSLANDVMTDILINHRYDSTKGDFEGLLYNALFFSFIDNFEYNNRDKRTSKITMNVNGECKRIPVKDVYMDEPLLEEGDITLRDTLASDYNLEQEVMEEEEISNPKLIKFLNGLSFTQQSILHLLKDDYKPAEIRTRLHITEKEYNENMSVIHSYENIKILL